MNLLAYDSPKYLRRLAREINRHIDGVYCNGKRWTHAVTERLPGCRRIDLKLMRRTGELHEQMIIDGWAPITDSYGKSVVVSRENK